MNFKMNDVTIINTLYAVVGSAFVYSFVVVLMRYAHHG